MDHKLSPDETAELMAEIDLDRSGSVEVNEFLDKVRQAKNERQADCKRCRQLFDECDDDGSGSLDEQEMVYCMTHMGLAVQVQDPEFIKQMIEINTLAEASQSRPPTGNAPSKFRSKSQVLITA
jgi:Ca2+-binding EF-hand superfamily protein